MHEGCPHHHPNTYDPSLGEPDVELAGVRFAYGAEPVLDGVDLAIPPRDFLGIIGPNGAGKTTLLRVLTGLLTPQAGRVRLFGQPPERGRRHVGYVPQTARFDRDFPITVMELALTGRLRHAPRLLGYRAADRAAAEAALERMGVADLRRKAVGELSGGQLQRVLIARALAGEPRLLALDEPAASVDTRFQHRLHETLRELNEQMTIVLISHDLGFVASFVRHVACLNRRLVCHPTTQITPELLERLYEGGVRMVDHGHKF